MFLMLGLEEKGQFLTFRKVSKTFIVKVSLTRCKMSTGDMSYLSSFLFRFLVVPRPRAGGNSLKLKVSRDRA